MSDKELFDCGCEDENCDDYHDEFDDYCGCGCNDDEIITLTLEDGTDVDCAIIAVFPVEEKEYIALLPLDDNEEDGEIFLYEFKEVEDGIELSNIESDDEYELVTEAFDEILDEADLEELFDDEL